MPIWFSALGVACIGVVCGYVMFYSLKRIQPPMAKTPLPLTEVAALLIATGAGGALGKAFVDLGGVNYIGGYGIGLLIGMTMNILLSILSENQRSHHKQIKKDGIGPNEAPE